MELDTFLTSSILVLLATSIAVALFKHIGFGSVLGLLFAGIVVGPHSPGPQVIEHVEDIRHFTELGVVLLLFLIGLEMKPSRLWAMRRDVLGLGSLQILVSGVAIGIYFFMVQFPWDIAVFTGLAFALSSTAFGLQLLQEKGEIASEKGRTAFSILLMQDIAVVPLLAMIPIISVTGTLEKSIPVWLEVFIVAGVVLAIALLGKYALPQALHYLAIKRNKEGFFLTVLLSVLLAAWIMHYAGVSMALGTFVLGMMLSDCRYRLQVQAHIEPFKGILMSLFFVAVGMSIDIHALAMQPFLFLQHVAAVIIIKVIVLFVLITAFGHTRAVATGVAFLMAQGGEFGFVLFGSAKAFQLIDDATFIYAVGVISITMLITPFLVRLGNTISERMEKRQAVNHGVPALDADQPEKSVVIGGYGRVGHAVATVLQNSGIRVLAFDTDPGRVAQGRSDGLPVYFGDVGDPELLSSIHVDQASLVVITIDTPKTAEQAVSHIRAQYPTVPVIARARDLEAVSRMINAGANHAYPEAVESSLRLAGFALELLDIPSESVNSLIKGVRTNDYALITESDPDETKKSN